MAAELIRSPVLVFALAREYQAVRRGWRRGRCWREAPCLARWYTRQGCSLLVLQTGVGCQAAARALDWLLSQPLHDHTPFRPSLVVLAGFSGALQPDLQVGDLVLASEVVDSTGRAWPGLSSRFFRESCGVDGQRAHVGRIATTNELLGIPEEKNALGRQHQALAVDMESGAVARACAEHGVPLACIRTISDDLDSTLSPRLIDLLQGGKVSIPRLLLALVRDPRIAAQLWRLARDTDRAGKNLAGPLEQVLAAHQQGEEMTTCFPAQEAVGEAVPTGRE